MGMEQKRSESTNASCTGEMLKFAQWLEQQGYLNMVDVDYDWEESAHETSVALSAEDVVKEYEEREKN